MASFYVANGMRDSEHTPSRERLRELLEAIEPADVEHGAAWLCDDAGNCLEFSSNGILAFSNGTGVPRHLVGVSKERALALWLSLAGAQLSDVERELWQPGARPQPTPQQSARREREMDAWQRAQDREFYDCLGPERSGEPCRREACRRGRITDGVLCRVHHFESLRGRPCPFDE